jgi:hypothetical protein
MKRDELYSTILGCSVSGFYKWKKQNRLIISLLQEYFSDSDLLEWVKNQKITKLELIKDFEMILLGSKIDYLKFINENLLLDFKYDLFTDLYYKFLIYLNDMQRSEDVENYKTWIVGDAIPGFFIKHTISTEKEHEVDTLQYKFGLVNDFDQNMSNFIRLNLSRDMLPLATNNIGSNIEISEAYRQSAVHHVILYNIYKKYPTLTYQEKMLKLGEVYGFDLNNQSADNFKKIISMPNGWKMAEIDIEKYLKKI